VRALPSKQILLEKEREIDELAAAISKYRTITLIGIQGVSGRMLSDLRSRLRGFAEVKVVKNSTALRALQSSAKEKPGVEKLTALLKGSNALILSHASPFLIAKEVEDLHETDWVKPGSPAPKDIIIQAADLGLPPGGPASILTDMGAKTKIVKGMIRLDEDLALAKKGERITPAMAALLMALEIKPVESSFKLLGAWDGVYIPGEALHLDLDKTKEELLLATNSALGLAVSAEIYTEESAPMIFRKAILNAKALSSMGVIYGPDEMKEALIKAAVTATAVHSRLKKH